MSSAFDRVFTRGLQSSTPRKTEVLRPASIHPRIPVGCAALRLRTRFTVFADRGARSRPLLNTRSNAPTSRAQRMRACSPTADAQTPHHRQTGKRVSETSASTPVNAFELRPGSFGHLSRVTDVIESAAWIPARTTFRVRVVFTMRERSGPFVTSMVRATF